MCWSGEASAALAAAGLASTAYLAVKKKKVNISGFHWRIFR